MAEKLPELAIDGNFSSEAFNPDDKGIYQMVEYRRPDGTLYMRSQLSYLMGDGRYGKATQTYYDRTGTIAMFSTEWNLSYDINKKIISKKKVN